MLLVDQIYIWLSCNRISVSRAVAYSCLMQPVTLSAAKLLSQTQPHQSQSPKVNILGMSRLLHLQNSHPEYTEQPLCIVFISSIFFCDSLGNILFTFQCFKAASVIAINGDIFNNTVELVKDLWRLLPHFHGRENNLNNWWMSVFYSVCEINNPDVTLPFTRVWHAWKITFTWI